MELINKINIAFNIQKDSTCYFNDIIDISKGISIQDPYTHYIIGDNTITLDGDYTKEQLKLLIEFMEVL